MCSVVTQRDDPRLRKGVPRPTEPVSAVPSSAVGADSQPEGHEPEDTPFDPASVDWSQLPLDDPRWELIDDVDLDDDDEDDRHLPPDPSQRAWRHPAEIAAANAHMERSMLEDARNGHPSALGTETVESTLPSRVMLAVAAGALVVAGAAIWSTNRETVASETAAVTEAVAAATNTESIGSVAVDDLSPSTTVVPFTDPDPSTDSTLGSGAALLIEQIEAPPAWAYQVLSGGDELTSTTLATAVRFSSLDPELLVTSASALGDRTTVTLAQQEPDSDRPRLSTGVVLGTDAETDIAVIRMGVPGESARSARIVSSTDNLVGSDVSVRSGVGTRPHEGTVLAVGNDFIETSAPSPEGHLGAALTNRYGRVVGLVVNGSSMLASAIPADETVRIAANIADYGRANPNWLGLTVTTEDGLVKVVAVVEGGPADSAGIQVDDRLLGVNGSLILTPDHLSEAVAAERPGADLSLVIERNDEIQTLDCQVGQRPKTASTPVWIDT